MSANPEKETLSLKAWVSLLREFHAVSPSDKNARETLLRVKEKAQATPELTYRQMEGIIGRCDYELYLLENPDERRGISAHNIKKAVK